MINQKDIITLLQRGPGEISNLIALMREKGLRYYGRPLLMAALPLMGIYFFIYEGPSGNLAKVREDISNLDSVVKYAAQYEDLESQLQIYYSKLPHPKDKDRGRWLTDAVRETLKGEGVFLTSFSAASEKVQGGFVVVSINVVCKVQYQQLASWVARLESSKQGIQISRLTMSKEPSDIGMNQVDIGIAAVFPQTEEGP